MKYLFEMDSSRKIESEADLYEDMFDLLSKIRVRPQLFFGVANPPLSRISDFIFTYTFAFSRITGKSSAFWYYFQGFTEFKYRIRSTKGWHRIIEEHSENNEQSLEEFYKILDEFKELYENRELDTLLK